MAFVEIEGTITENFRAYIRLEKLGAIKETLGDCAGFVSRFSTDCATGTSITIAVPKGRLSEVHSALERFSELVGEPSSSGTCRLGTPMRRRQQAESCLSTSSTSTASTRSC